MFLIGPLVAIAIAVVTISLALSLRRGHQAVLADITAALAKRGLRHRGLSSPAVPSPTPQEALDAPQRGIAIEREDGARVSLSAIATEGAATLPGFGPTHPQHTLVELDLALPDQLICTPERAQAAFGPFPPHARTTGNRAFDRRFGVFVRDEDARGYRSTASAPTPWAHAPAAAAIFADFETLGFVALHVHEGRGRLLFAPQAVDGLVAALDTATALAHPEAPRAPAPPPTRLQTGTAALLLIFGISIAPLTAGMPLLSSLTEEGSALAGNDVACPRGGTFKKGRRHGPDNCVTPGATSYRAESAAYGSWQFCIWAPIWISVIATGYALAFKLRSDAAREVRRRLVPQ
ncbi:Hypothetical protein A7982_03568 [Minicystis rosea]|nr:Hypothetical protein A7982_03568 [Minicystis rosea]